MSQNFRVSLLVTFLGVSLLLCGCSGGGGGGAVGPDPVASSVPIEPVPTVVATATPGPSGESVSSFISSSQGGTLRSSAGAEFILPPSALSQDANVSLQPLSGLPKPLPAGFSQVGRSFQITLGNATLQGHSEIRISVENAANRAVTDEESSIVVWTGSEWLELPSSTAAPSGRSLAPDSKSHTEIRGTVPPLGDSLANGKEIMLAAAVVLFVNPPVAYNVYGLVDPLHPIPGKRYAVIVHGINTDADQQGYRDLKAKIESWGIYAQVARFEYEYTSGAIKAADKLGEALDSRFAGSGATVDIYAHSFGGLVARAFAFRAAKDNGTAYVHRGYVKRLFLIGAPNNGTIAATRDGLDTLFLNAGAELLNGKTVNWKKNDPSLQDLKPGSDLLEGIRPMTSEIHYFFLGGDRFPLAQGDGPRSTEDQVYKTLHSIARFPSRSDGLVPPESAVPVPDSGYVRSAVLHLNHSELLTQYAALQQLETWLREDLRASSPSLPVPQPVPPSSPAGQPAPPSPSPVSPPSAQPPGSSPAPSPAPLPPGVVITPPPAPPPAATAPSPGQGAPDPVPFVNTYLASGGEQEVGRAVNTVHRWGSGWTQDFDGGRAGAGALMQHDGDSYVFWVHGSIWRKYITTGGPHRFGYPRSNEGDGLVSPFGTRGRYQAFERGNMEWMSNGPKAGETLWVFGGFFARWKEMGYSGSRLGWPLSEEFFWSNLTRQNFEGGYMTWDGQSVRVYYY